MPVSAAEISDEDVELHSDEGGPALSQEIPAEDEGIGPEESLESEGGTSGAQEPEPAESPESAQRSFSPQSTQVGDEALRVINAERAKSGLAPINNCPNLQKAAQTWSEYMAGASRLVHMATVHDMTYQNKFARDAGWQIGGDLIAAGYRSETSVANGWLSSSGHRAWLMNHHTPVGAAGLGVATAPNGAYYWTLYVGGGKQTVPTPNFSVSTSVSGTRSSGNTLTMTGSVSGVSSSDITHKYTWKDGNRTVGSSRTLNLTNAHAGKTLTATYTATHTPSGKAVSRSVSVTISDIQVRRLSQADRYGTNAAVANATRTRGAPAFVATGASFPDALSVGPAVSVTNGTLFLSGRTRVADSVLNSMRSMAPSRVYVIGGTGAISNAVVNQIRAATGVPVERVSGNNRYETSAAIYQKFFAHRSVPMAFVATGRDYPDALTAAAAGGALKAPVILVDGRRGSNIDAGVRNSLRLKTGTVALVGGTSVVNTSIQSNLRQSFGSVQRLSGNNRYGTNLAVNNYLDSRGGTPAKGIWVATAWGFPDALSAAVPAGKLDQRLVLSGRQCVPRPVVSDSIRSASSQVSMVTLVGGPSVLNSAVGRLTECG